MKQLKILIKTRNKVYDFNISQGLSLFGISIWSLLLPSFSQGKLSPGKPVGVPYGFGFLDATQVPE